MRESDLYEPVKAYFSDQGYAIYAEVGVRYCGGRVDVVAYNHPAAIAIELKQSLTFDLIDQAMARKAVFPLVYIAYPKKKRGPVGWLHRFFIEQGIGVLEVKGDEVKCLLPARYRQPAVRKMDWKSILKPEHQEWVPGGHAGGGYVTDYALTMKGVRHFLSSARRQGEMHMKLAGPETDLLSSKLPSVYHGWRTVAEILEHCETHYATPKNSLGKALLEIEFKWCESKKENGRLYFRHKEEG